MRGQTDAMNRSGARLPEINLVQIGGQDLLLRVLPHQQHGAHGLAQLAKKTLLLGEIQGAHELLGDRAAALDHAPRPQVGEQRPADAREVETEVTFEAMVLDDQHRIEEVPGHLMQQGRRASRAAPRPRARRLRSRGRSKIPGAVGSRSVFHPCATPASPGFLPCSSQSTASGGRHSAARSW